MRKAARCEKQPGPALLWSAPAEKELQTCDMLKPLKQGTCFASSAAECHEGLAQRAWRQLLCASVKALADTVSCGGAKQALCTFCPMLPHQRIAPSLAMLTPRYHWGFMKATHHVLRCGWDAFCHPL